MSSLLRSLAAAVAIVGTIALGCSALVFPPTSTVVSPAIGADLFAKRCARCHSFEGGSSTYGPTLEGVGEWAATRAPGQSATQYIYTSIVEPDAYHAEGQPTMPANVAEGLGRDELLSLTAFLCEHGGSPSLGALLALPDPPTRAEGSTRHLELASIERGRELFLGELGCARCHNLNHYPGYTLIAPSLLEVGVHARPHLEESILKPAAQILPGFEQWSVARNGLITTGRKLPSPEGTVRIVKSDDKGNFEVLTFDTDELEPLGEGGEFAVRLEGASLMPSFEEALDRDDLDALLDFLTTLQ